MLPKYRPTIRRLNPWWHFILACFFLGLLFVYLFCSVKLWTNIPGEKGKACLSLNIKDPQGIINKLPRNMIAIVTAAFSSIESERREKEYRLGLGYIFSSFDRVFGLVSSAKPWEFINAYPFENKPTYFMSNYSQKSAQESHGLREISRSLLRADINDEDIIFKISGRYQIARSDFLEEVLLNPDYDVWGKAFGSWHLDNDGKHVVLPGDSKIFTFLWAMRWKHFSDLYTNVDLNKLETYDGNKGWFGYDIESYVMDYVKSRGLKMFRTSYLHVVSNIDNRGFLVYF